MTQGRNPSNFPPPDDLTSWTIHDFLCRTADRAPTPGGGSVTALVGALACALARMAAAYSAGGKSDPAVAAAVDDIASRLRRAEQLMQALVTQDAAAYEAMTAAARSKNDGSGSAADYQQAVLAAVAVPMEVAAVASQALADMNELKGIAGRSMLSDLGVCAVLAEAVTRAARYLVMVNAACLADTNSRQRVASEIHTIVEHAARHRESVESAVEAHLNLAASAGR